MGKLCFKAKSDTSNPEEIQSNTEEKKTGKNGSQMEKNEMTFEWGALFLVIRGAPDKLSGRIADFRTIRYPAGYFSLSDRIDSRILEVAFFRLPFLLTSFKCHTQSHI